MHNPKLYKEYLKSPSDLTPLSEAVLDLITARGSIKTTEISRNEKLSRRFPISLSMLPDILDYLEKRQRYIRRTENNEWEITEKGSRYFTEY